MIITLNQSAGTAQKGCGEWVSLLKDVCSNVCKEPTLHPLTGESLQLRSASIDDGVLDWTSLLKVFGGIGTKAFF